MIHSLRPSIWPLCFLLTLCLCDMHQYNLVHLFMVAYTNLVPMHGEESHDRVYIMAMTLKMKRNIINCEFPIDRISHMA